MFNLPIGRLRRHKHDLPDPLQSRLTGSPQDRYGYWASVCKAELPVEGVRTLVVAVDVQKWRLPPSEDILRQGSDKEGCITARGVIGVGAHRRDFSEAVEPHAFARHCYQLANTNVGSERNRPRGTPPPGQSTRFIISGTSVRTNSRIRRRWALLESP